MKSITINLDVNKEGKPFSNFYQKCVGAGRAGEGLRADWQTQLKMAVDECGFEYIRFHGLFADDMFVFMTEDGQVRYNWQYIDSLFDALLDIGIRPFVELGFTPSDLASGDKTVFWWKGNVTPPASYEQWADMVGSAVRHWIERYGIEEVLQWYFEVWNEPNLPPFWAGSKSEYFELYRVTAEVIKGIHQELKVGGPATSNFVPDERFDGEKEDLSKHVTHKVEDIDSLSWKGVWIEDFLAYCAEHDLPVDFVSTHPYPTDFALDEHSEISGRTRHKESIKEDMQWLHDVVRNSKYKDAEIHLTEWSSSPTSRDYSHDYLPAANYIVKSNIDCNGLADSLSYWVFTDIFEEAGGGPKCFHGGFGMVNIQGIKKPSFHAYRFLSKLGREELLRGESYIVTKNSEGKVRALFYNYADELKQTIPISYYPNYHGAEEIQELGEEIHVKGVLSGFAAGTRVDLEILDVNHGNVTTKWKELGYPDSLTREQTAELKAYADDTKKITIYADNQGNLSLDFTMGKWAIVLIEEN